MIVYLYLILLVERSLYYQILTQMYRLDFYCYLNNSLDVDYITKMSYFCLKEKRLKKV